MMSGGGVAGYNSGSSSTRYTGQLVCPHCPKSVSFTCTSNFRRHLRLHSGERPYACTLCSYTATRKQHLQSHILRRHDNYQLSSSRAAPPGGSEEHRQNQSLHDRSLATLASPQTSDHFSQQQ